MRRLAKVVAALAFAAAAAFGTAAPAAATGPLVNVVVTDVLTGNTVVVLQNVTVPVAAALCDIDVNVLSGQLDQNGHGSCPALTNITKVAGVIYA